MTKIFVCTSSQTIPISTSPSDTWCQIFKDYFSIFQFIFMDNLVFPFSFNRSTELVHAWPTSQGSCDDPISQRLINLMTFSNDQYFK